MKRMNKEIGTIPTPLSVLWKVGMKRIFTTFLILLSAHSQVYAGAVPDDTKTEAALKANVVDFRDWLMKQLSQFPKADPARAMVRRYAYIPRKQRVITANQYDQAAKSDWVKCQVMQGLSTLSQQLANTAGTAFAPQSASQLQQYAVQLKQSDDPQFQQVGALYTQEAQALQSGNTQGADQAASQVAAVPQPYVAPGYQPTQSETSFATTVRQIIGSLIGTVINAVVAIYGGPVASSMFSPAIQSAFGGGQNPGISLGAGQSSGVIFGNPVTNNLQSGGSVGIQQLEGVTVKQLQPQGSSNAGGAPSAQ
jgi:hypothetical protein